MTKHIRCSLCGQFVTYASSMPTPGGSGRVHLHGVGCRKPTVEQIPVVKTTIAFVVPRTAFNPLAAAFARAGLVSLHASA